MAGIIGTLQEVLTAVARLAAIERAQSAAAKEMRDDLRAIEQRLAALDTRLAVLESRFDGLAHNSATEARAAAQAAAALAMGGHLAVIAERLARLEAGAPGAPRTALPAP